jgi:RNA polymerase sigma-70 factor (ECF subfamily)
MQGDWSSLGDAELVEAFKAGKLSAFTQLVDRHQRSLINFFFHFCWDRQISEDCAQEVFLRLYAHLGTWEPQAKFTTFLFRVARNLWIDRARTAAVHGKPQSLDAAGGGGDERPLRDRLAGPVLSPVDILSRQEEAEALQRAIELLPEDQKTVLILGEIQGMKYQDVAAILEIPVGTVKSRMHTAVERLKELLAESER